MSEKTGVQTRENDRSTEPSSTQTVLDALRGLQFGSVTLLVQDGVIVQVERLEKKRLARPVRA